MTKKSQNNGSINMNKYILNLILGNKRFLGMNLRTIDISIKFRTSIKSSITINNRYLAYRSKLIDLEINHSLNHNLLNPMFLIMNNKLLD